MSGYCRILKRSKSANKYVFKERKLKNIFLTDYQMKLSALFLILSIQLPTERSSIARCLFVQFLFQVFQFFSLIDHLFLLPADFFLQDSLAIINLFRLVIFIFNKETSMYTFSIADVMSVDVM